MARSRTRQNASSGEGGKAQRKTAAEVVGQPFLTTTVDVVRDGKIVRVQGGRLVDDLSEELTDEERKPLEESGAIRAATQEDAQTSVDSVAREDARERNAEHERQRQALLTEQAGERAKIEQEYNSERDAKLTELSQKHSEALESLNQKLASE
jgi:vacuolar-type H+-ATPase subunit I/STV1